MTTTSESTTAVRGVERRTIDVIPPEERHGTPLSQFTLWMGANLQITAIVDGALAVVFGADALWAIIGLLIGNLLGGIVMALHSAQGPRLGLPQMISSRAQFGDLRRDRAAGPGDRDVPRLHRDRHGPRRPGDQRAAAGRQRRRSASCSSWRSSR